MFQTEVTEKTKRHLICSIDFFPENYVIFWDNVEKCRTAGQVTVFDFGDCCFDICLLYCLHLFCLCVVFFLTSFMSDCRMIELWTFEMIYVCIYSNMAHVRCMLDTGCKCTLRISNTAFALQQWFHEHFWVLNYMYFSCLVNLRCSPGFIESYS
jgi:hypothetical protein